MSLVATAIIALLAQLTRILWRTRSPVAFWYGAAMGVTLFASIAEVLGAAAGARGLTEVVNSVTAAFSSSLLASLAVAAQMKLERDQRLAAQRRLQSTYEVMPVGLFSANLKGQFTNANPALLQLFGDKLLTEMPRVK